MIRYWVVRAVVRFGIDHNSKLYLFLVSVYKNISLDFRQGCRRTYSAYGEDVFLINFFGTATGRYVDVGSGHPMRGSNTFVLYQRGWNGICIDPINANIELARRFRPRDESILALSGFTQDEIQFWEYESYGYSTTIQSRVDELALAGEHPIRTHTMSVIPLSSLNISATPKDPYVLSIDVEGAEMEVLKGNDWTTFIPSVIVIEEWLPPWEKVSEIKEFLNLKGYELRNYIGVSSIYVHTSSPVWIQ